MDTKFLKSYKTTTTLQVAFEHAGSPLNTGDWAFWSGSFLALFSKETVWGLERWLRGSELLLSFQRIVDSLPSTSQPSRTPVPGSSASSGIYSQYQACTWCTGAQVQAEHPHAFKKEPLEELMILNSFFSLLRTLLCALTFYVKEYVVSS